MTSTAPTPAADAAVNGLAEVIATGCQILADTGLAPDILGHISVRIGDDQALVRCRGPRERGLAATTADDVHAVPITAPPGGLDGWSAPSELPIHTAILRARPEVTAVVHAHPRAVVAMSLAGLPWRPVFGAYDIPAARIAAGGIPTWPRAALVNTPELGADLAATLADRPVAALYGHGLVSVGHGSPEDAIAEAVTHAVAVDSLARMTLAVRQVGVEAPPISDADLAQLPDLGAGLNVRAMWRHLCARVAAGHC